MPTFAIGSGSGSNFKDLDYDDDVIIEEPFSKFSKVISVSEGGYKIKKIATKINLIFCYGKGRIVLIIQSWQA